MKIGLIGSEDRRHFWEKQLSSFDNVREIIHTDSLEAIGHADACIILEQDPQIALQSMRKGYPTFLVSRLVTDPDLARKLYFTSEEAGVPFMISNWSLFSPATKWMVDTIPNPYFIHISRNLPWDKFSRSSISWESLWTEELALCLKWMNSSIHKIDVSTTKISPSIITGIHISIRYENSGTSIIHITLCGSQETYTRQASGTHQEVWSDVLEKEIQWGRMIDNGEFSYRKISIDHKEPSRQAISYFFRALKDRTSPAYNAHDLNTFAKAANQVDEFLKRTVA